MHPYRLPAAAVFAAGTAFILITGFFPAAAFAAAAASEPASPRKSETAPTAAAIDPVTAPAASPVSATLINSLVAEAVRAHPKSEAARARTLAAWQALDAIPLWDDPMAGVGLMAADKMMRRDDGDIVVGIEQTLPKPGLYRAEKNRAAAEAGMAGAEADRKSVV